MKPTYTRIMRTMAAEPWALLPETLETMCGLIEARANGAPSFTTEEIRAHMGARAAAGGVTLQGGGAVAVVPLVGVLANKMNMMTNLSGGTSLDQFRNQFRRALADATVKAIVIAIDSPGGSVVGCDETWTEIFNARGVKPIVASVDAMMASAALWIGSACDAIEITPSGVAGSLGVFVVHTDASEAEAKAGIKVTYVASEISPFKTEANPDEPLSDSARAYRQSRVNEVADLFLKQVAKGRGIPAATAQKNFGGGRAMSAQAALAAKMVDRIATFEETVSRLMGSNAKNRATAMGATAASAESKMLECHCAPDCPCAQNGFCQTNCATCQPGCVCLGEARADHTDTGRGPGGKFKAQCDCDPGCPCMNDGPDVCQDDCMTCAPTCACLKPVAVAAPASPAAPEASYDEAETIAVLG
jgi:signal peptide peptidase SppA